MYNQNPTGYAVPNFSPQPVQGVPAAGTIGFPGPAAPTVNPNPNYLISAAEYQNIIDALASYKYTTSQLSNQIQSMERMQQKMVMFNNCANAEIQRLKGKLDTKRKLRLDEYDKTWKMTERNSREVVIGDISIISVVFLKDADKSTPSTVLVKYNTNGAENTIEIPYTQFLKRKLLKYFPDFRKNPDCPESYINELLYMLTQDCKNLSEITLSAKGGWIKVEDDKMVYYKYDLVVDTPYINHISNCVRSTKLKDTSRPPETVIKDYLGILRSYNSFILWAIRNASFYLQIFEELGIFCNQLVIIEAHSDEEARYAVSMLKTFGRPSESTVSLSAPRGEVTSALNDTNDGVVVFKDTSNIDSNAKIKPALEIITNDLSNTTGDKGSSRHMIAVISRIVSSVFESEYSFRLIMDNYLPDMDNKRIQELSEEVDSLTIRYISGNLPTVKKQIKDLLEAIKCKDDFDCRNSFDMYRILTISLLTTMSLLKIETKDEFQKTLLSLIKQSVLSSNEYDTSYSQTIEKDFSNVVNKMLVDNTLKVIACTPDTQFKKSSNILLYKSGILSFEPETIKNTILPQMKTVKNIDKLITAMKECGNLKCTNKNRHPIDLFDENGCPLRLHAYCFTNILSKDIKLRLENIEVADWLITAEEMRSNEFLPLAGTYDGKLIGKRIRMEDAENNHIYVSGQSGYGKTFCLSQIAAGYVGLGHRTVIFDTSGSFTKTALDRNLSPEFVEKNFSFIDIGDQPIPVNLLDISDYDTLPRRKNALTGILNVIAPHLGEQQIAVIKKVVAEAVKNPVDSVKTEDINLYLKIMIEDEKDKNAQSVLNRLDAVFDDINAMGMAQDKWEDLFDTCKPVIVLSSSTGAGDNNHQLIDMMLASLYNYQLLRNNEQLNIIIDEIQNQNLTKYSPIFKILSEGRKYHIAFVGATQPFHIKGDSVGDVMSKADTQIFLKPELESENNVAKVLGYDSKKRQYFASNCPAAIKGHIAKATEEKTTN